MLSQTAIDNASNMISNHTQNSILQERKGSFRYSVVVPVSSSVTEEDLECQENDSSAHATVIDLHNPHPYPFVLSFTNLSYSVVLDSKFPLPKANAETGTKTKTKLILENISGEAREGEITAVLGPSGAGKSTLIDSLAGRIKKESLEGSVKLNGQVLGSRLLKVISSYVMQDDLLFPMLTVEETLMFSAEFRLPRSVSKQKKRARVEALIDQLGLRASAKTVIGDEEHRGVSGGERRRVSIGIDIIHDPILLFLDEPTSGLDSTSAFTVVNVLQQIAKNGSIVIMSVHQPSTRIVSLLDNMIFLSQGKMVYNAKPSCLIPFFEEFGHQIPETVSPTEFAIDLIRELETTTGITNLVEFNNSWQTRNNQNTHCDVSLDDAMKTRTHSPITSTISKFANPFWIETGVLAKRLFLNSKRMPELFGTRLAAALTTSIILATLFWQIDATPKGAQERFGFAAYLLVSVFLNCATEVPTYLQERHIFQRETAYNAYRHSSYVLADSLVSIPSTISLSLAMAITTFYSVGLSGGIFVYFLMIFSSFWAGSGLVAFVTGLVSQTLVAFLLVVSFLGYSLLFCGFFITRSQIPPYWTWFHYLSIVKYPYEGVMVNELSDPTRCFVRGVQIFQDGPMEDLALSMKWKLLESMGNVLGRDLTSSGSTCLISGAEILKQKELLGMNKWTCVWITLGYGMLFRVLFYFTLLFGRKNKRN